MWPSSLSQCTSRAQRCVFALRVCACRGSLAIGRRSSLGAVSFLKAQVDLARSACACGAGIGLAELVPCMGGLCLASAGKVSRLSIVTRLMKYYEFCYHELKNNEIHKLNQ